MRGWEGEGCLVIWVRGMRGLEGVGGGGLSGCMGQRDYMRRGGLSTPSGVVGLIINVKMTFKFVIC